MIRATLVYLVVSVYILVVSPIALAWALISKRTSHIYILARFCIRLAGLICGVRVRSRGREKILPGQTYVFLSNHQSNFDGPVLAHAIPRNWRALIKKEMMRLPVFSLVLKQVKMVPIDRSDPQKARDSIEHGARLLQEGYSFIAFPEGTRSRDGRLREFKKGVFVMILKARTPVVPITIVNSNKVQPPGEYSIRPGVIEVVFHDPIITEGMGFEDRDRLIEMTRAAIAGSLPS